ncbi:hypothetical protein S40288_06099, partial [Stachybotrys chartarum IBT 40288]
MRFNAIALLALGLGHVHAQLADWSVKGNGVDSFQAEVDFEDDKRYKHHHHRPETSKTHHHHYPRPTHHHHHHHQQPPSPRPCHECHHWSQHGCGHCKYLDKPKALPCPCEEDKSKPCPCRPKPYHPPPPPCRDGNCPKKSCDKCGDEWAKPGCWHCKPFKDCDEPCYKTKTEKFETTIVKVVTPCPVTTTKTPCPPKTTSTSCATTASTPCP